MCMYVTKKELKEPKRIIIEWILRVQKKVKQEKEIRFQWYPIGSGKRNMVVRQCDNIFFDLDYQITLTHLPKDLEGKAKSKDIKDYFRMMFNELKPKEFEDCQDSTQALTTINKTKTFGYDIIITNRDYQNNLYILYNKKNTNNANNEDYFWAPKSELSNYWSLYAEIIKNGKYDQLRKRYLIKRCEYKNNEKKSYQILNEAINDVLKSK